MMRKVFPIPTGRCHVKTVYVLIQPIASRNRVKNANNKLSAALILTLIPNFRITFTNPNSSAQKADFRGIHKQRHHFSEGGGGGKLITDV